MNIAIRLEGGIGDHLLGNRFVHAIHEKYPNANLNIFSDTEDNPRHISLLKDLWPRLYNNTTVLKHRTDQNFKIQSIFGEEAYPAHISNLPDDFESLTKTFDKFYDLHIDSLKWLNYDFDWLRYYYFFPKPDINIETGNEYIMAHLYSRPNSPYNLEQWYVLKLLNKLSENNKIVIVTQADHVDFYSELFDNKNIKIECPESPLEIFKISAKCKLFIGIDSGVRYMPYHFSKPTYLFSKYCGSYGQVAHSHLIRWLIFPKNVFPMHFNIDSVSNIINNNFKHNGYILFPEIQSDIEKYIVDRKL
jgi:ADP-heptose:LPS heptosyltransferase